MKLIVAGSRNFVFYSLLEVQLDKIKSHITEIVSGTANGADKLGEKYAKFNNIPIKQFPANWNLYDKRSGYLRNRSMAEYADGLIAFWNGYSKGTKSMIALAQEYDLAFIRIIRYNDNTYSIIQN